MKFRLILYTYFCCFMFITLFPFAQAQGNKKNILITAFGPYGGMEKNPSEMIMNKMMHMENKSPKIHFTFKLLRVVYNDVDEFIKETDLNKYNMIVMMGLNPDSKVMLIETVGINLSDHTKDIDSIARPGYIISKGPVRLKLQEKYIKKMQKYVKRKKLPFLFSQNDGNYVCNYLNYLMRYCVLKIDTEKPVLFFHVANSIEFSSAPRNEEQANHIMGLIKHLAK